METSRRPTATSSREQRSGTYMVERGGKPKRKQPIYVILGDSPAGPHDLDTERASSVGTRFANTTITTWKPRSGTSNQRMKPPHKPYSPSETPYRASSETDRKKPPNRKFLLEDDTKAPTNRAFRVRLNTLTPRRSRLLTEPDGNPGAAFRP